MEIKKLDNGLTAVVVNNSASDVVSIQIWVKCGSIYEEAQEYGVSHFIEHLLFKGTRKHGVGDVAKVIESLGGDLNAFTSKEYTCYYVTLPSKYFSEGLGTLKELVYFPTFDSSEIEFEREVILEEIRRYQDIPGSVVSDKYFELHFKGHPYSRPILGYDEVIKNISRESIVSYYTKFYNAKNSIVVVCGDVEEKDTIDLIERNFEDINSLPIEEIKVKKINHNKGQDVSIIEMDIKESVVEFGFPAPDLFSEDVPALDVLGIILGRGESSRLVSVLRLQKALVTSITVDTYTPLYGGTFSFVFGFEHGSDKCLNRFRNIIIAMVGELCGLKKSGISDEEIEKAKNILLSSRIYEKETVEGYARKIGHLICVTGDLDFEQRYFKMLAKVSKMDVLNVFNKYFRPEQVTLSAVVPNGVNLDKNRVFSELLDSLRLVVDTKTTELVDSSQVMNDKMAEFYDIDKLFKIEKPVFYNSGPIRVIKRKINTTPMISLKVFMKGGVLIENKDNNGICNLLARTWLFGAGNMDFYQIANTIDYTASDIHAFSGRNSIGLSVECIKPYFGELLEILKKIILEPNFNEELFLAEKSVIQSEINSVQDKLSRYTNLLFLKSIYNQHPYSLEPMGTVETLTKLTVQDVKSLYSKVLNPENIVVSIVGDFDDIEFDKWLNSVTASIKETNVEINKISNIDEQTNSRKVVFTKETKQAHIILGYKTCVLGSKDVATIRVLSSMLSGQSGRLFMNLRDKQSLAYTVMPIEMFGPEPGYFAVYIATENSKTDKAIEEIRREINQLKTVKVTQEDLDRAKNFLLGRHSISLQSYSEQASSMALDALFGLPYDSMLNYSGDILKVSSEDIIDVASRYFLEEKENLAIVKNP